MNLSNETKIINITTELIEQNNGNLEIITARTIAEKAGVALGLINYYFGSKKKLIALCVQNIISQAIDNFNVRESFPTPKEQLLTTATYVFEFLFEHPSIAKISILNDSESYSIDSNSASTQKGFCSVLSAHYSLNTSMRLSFILTSSMQTAFLSRNLSKQMLDYDFEKKTDRKLFIRHLVTTLLNGEDEKMYE